MTLEESSNMLLDNVDFPRQFIVPAFTGPIPILITVPIIHEDGLTLRLNHHCVHGIFSEPGAAVCVIRPQTPLTSTILQFDHVPDPIPSYICVYADIPGLRPTKVDTSTLYVGTFHNVTSYSTLNT